MKVWIVTECMSTTGRWKTNSGIFSTEEHAREYVQEKETDENWRVSYDIEEWRLEERAATEETDVILKLGAVLRASWDLINETGDARRSLGIDAPPELENVYRASERLADVILGKES